MRTLLVDADILIYQAAAAVQIDMALEVDDTDLWHSVASLTDAYALAVKTLGGYMDNLEADHAVLCFTAGSNFRKDVYPLYKATRSKNRKPVVLKPLRAEMEKGHRCMEKPTLEGDDVMGILATSGNKIIKGEKVIVSIDKDMKQIPGLLCRDGETIEEVTPEEALDFFYMQVLTGDSTDEYPGCPGLGPVKARAVLDAAAGDPWGAIVKAYAKKDLTEDHAIVQARCAKILDVDHYDFKKKAPILWTPKKSASSASTAQPCSPVKAPSPTTSASTASSS